MRQIRSFGCWRPGVCGRSAGLCWWGVAVVALLLPTASRGQWIAGDLSPSFCLARGQYFDSTALSCRFCGLNQTVAPSGLACECLPRFRLASSSFINGEQGVSLSCVRCELNTVVSADGLHCIPCPGSGDTGVCTCSGASNQALVDSQPNGLPAASATCVACASGYYTKSSAESGISSCQRCPAGQTAGATPCTCVGGFTVAPDGLCVPSAPVIPPSASEIVFAELGRTVSSALLAFALPSAMHQCGASATNTTACQLLANLCVLTGYRMAAQACSMLVQITQQRAGGVQGWPAWPEGLPFVFFAPGTSVLSSASVAPRLTASLAAGTGLTTRLKLRLAQYDVRGAFRGWVAFGARMLLCSTTPARAGLHAAVGLAYTNNCVLDLSNSDFTTLHTRELMFYDPYLEDSDGSLLPVPVLLPVLLDSRGIAVSTQLDSSTQLVRRFFLADNISSVAVGGTVPQVLRVAASVALAVRFRSDAPGKIFLPLLTITYRELPASAPFVSVTYSASYEADTGPYRTGVAAAAGVCAGLAALATVLRLSSWSRRHGSAHIDGRTIAETLAMLCGAFSSLVVVVIVAAALYWLVFYRRQQAVDVLLPHAASDPFVALLVIAALCKLVEVARLIAVVTGVDVFLLDWEQPSFSSSDKPMAGPPLWRTVFVANEWAELQGIRSTSVPAQLLSVLFLLYVAGADNLASGAPASTPIDAAPDHYLLRFATVAILYLGVGLVQWMVSAAVLKRFVEDKLSQFVDLCSVSNISVLALRETLAGLYIHGRSVHGTAEVDMWLMRDHFRREETNMTSQRGLLPGSEVQVFEVHIPRTLRQSYDDVLSRVAHDNTGRGPGASDAALDGHARLTAFFCAYLEHSFPTLDYGVQEKMALAGLLDLTPAVGERGIFYPSVPSRVGDLLLMGHELPLFLLDFLVFTLIDYLASDFIVAAVVTYIIASIVCAFTASLGRRNIARKTLVDERFLI
jgi:meckelin